MHLYLSPKEGTFLQPGQGKNSENAGFGESDAEVTQVLVDSPSLACPSLNCSPPWLSVVFTSPSQLLLASLYSATRMFSHMSCDLRVKWWLCFNITHIKDLGRVEYGVRYKITLAPGRLRRKDWWMRLFLSAWWDFYHLNCMRHLGGLYFVSCHFIWNYVIIIFSGIT